MIGTLVLIPVGLLRSHAKICHFFHAFLQKQAYAKPWQYRKLRVFLHEHVCMDLSCPVNLPEDRSL